MAGKADELLTRGLAVLLNGALRELATGRLVVALVGMSVAVLVLERTVSRQAIRVAVAAADLVLMNLLLHVILFPVFPGADRSRAFAALAGCFAMGLVSPQFVFTPPPVAKRW